MRRYATGLGLVALVLGGCASTQVPEVGYLAPTGLPPAPRTASIRQQPELVFGNLVDRLQQDGFKVTHLDEQAGNVVVEYQGDPEPYVDCGWIVTYRRGDLERVPAASSSTDFDRRGNKTLFKMKRDLQLDVRMVIRVDRQGPDTLISPAATYVLTKMIDLTRRDGTPRASTHETISFTTGETGKFSKGSICQPNGSFERLVLDSLPAISVAASAPRPPAAVDGAAASAATVADAPAALPATVADDARAPPPIVANELATVAPEPAAGPATMALEPAPAPASVALEPAPAPASVTEEPAPARLPDQPAAAAAPAAPAAAPATLPVESAGPVPGPLQAKVAATTAALGCGAVDASFGDDNRVRLTGHVGSDEDIAQLRRALEQIEGLGTIETDLEVDPWPTCELLGVLAPYRPEASPAQPALTIATASRNTRLQQGDDLTLDIYLPRSARYLYLGYVQHDGRVGYIATLPVREWAEGTGAIRFATGFQVSEPYGREMIVAVASTHPLFEQARPGYEPASDYIEALRERLATLQAGETTPSVAVGHLFITTGPRTSS